MNNSISIPSSASRSTTPRASNPAIVEAKQHIRSCRKLIKIGITNATKITDTLQGSIWRTTQYPWSDALTNPHSTSVIKITNRALHRHQLGIINNTTFSVSEDILLEQSILKYLSQNKECPESVIKFCHFFETATDYFLVEEDGGACLFDFIRDAHRLIRKKKIAVCEWQSVVKIMFKQMIQCIDYIHSKNVVHFDISLENFLVNDIKIELEQKKNTKKARLRFVMEDIQIKLCDFGLAELFTKAECLSNKHHGKKQYKSPEVVGGKKGFDAKKNDIWCAGICLFMIATGCPPWDIAKRSDKTFRYCMKKSVRDLLRAWKMIKYVDSDLIDLLDAIFVYEEERVCLNGIKEHVYSRKAFAE